MKNIEDVPLRHGEYDLVNISLIGHDPVTGRNFDECVTEHEEAVARVLILANSLRWWDLVSRFKLMKKIANLAIRSGMGS